MNSIEDETDFIQYGQQIQTDFFNVNPQELSNDGWSADLTKNPNGLSYFADAYYLPSDNTETTTRQT